MTIYSPIENIDSFITFQQTEQRGSRLEDLSHTKIAITQ